VESVNIDFIFPEIHDVHLAFVVLDLVLGNSKIDIEFLLFSSYCFDFLLKSSLMCLEFFDIVLLGVDFFVFDLEF
jgi:hypothetical protein